MSSDVNTNDCVFDDDVIIGVRNVTKVFEMYDKPRHRLQQMMFGRFKTYYKEFKALDDVSFEIRRGECVGLIGRNGSGKSTILQIITGTLQATDGEVYIKPGLRIAALLELGSGFNPEFTGRENVYLNASILGFTKEETEKMFPAIEEFAEIGEFIDQPVKTYSSGMMVRLAFSVQIMTNPDILIIDEALAVGDAKFQEKCLSAMGKIFKERNCTVLFVSHSQQQVQQLCNRSILLKRGKKMYDGEVDKAFQTYNTDGGGQVSPREVDLRKVERVRVDQPVDIRARSFRLVDKEVAEFDFGEKVKIELTLEGIGKDISGFLFRLGIRAADKPGIALAATQSEENLSIRGGEQLKITFEVDLCYLVPGLYIFSLVISKRLVENKYYAYDNMENIYSFRVNRSANLLNGAPWVAGWWGNFALPPLNTECKVLTDEKRI